VVVVGLTIKGIVDAPVLQIYVNAPPAVNVALSPEQIVGEFTVTVGIGLTVTVVVPVATHPLASVIVTVYEVELAGQTLGEGPNKPQHQEYVYEGVPPEAVKESVVQLPAQTGEPEAPTVKSVGSVITIVADAVDRSLLSITVTVYVPEQTPLIVGVPSPTGLPGAQS